MTEHPLFKKLKMKEGQRVIALNAPEEYLRELNTLAPVVNIAKELEGQFDFIHLFVHNREDVEKYAQQTIKAIKPDGVLWISYPKGTSKIKTDINRDKGWDAIHALGFQVVSQVSVDDTWSASRFRPIVQE